MVRELHGMQMPDDAAVTALALRSQTPMDVVRHIYDEELAELDSMSTVKNFIEVIASRRVKDRLLRLASESATLRGANE
jgi:hypothetical protein